MSGPTCVVVEYEDSSRREIEFSKLGRNARVELAALGLCDFPPASGTYLLVQWQDGWKEVVAVDERATELLRYYTIERTEEIGRVSLEVAGSVPELLFIRRLPGSVESILLVGNEQVQAYSVGEKVTIREGGKAEHVGYDKVRSNFGRQSEAAASACFTEILGSLERELQSRDMSAEAVLVKDEGARLALYNQLADALGLRASERQQDVYGFLQAALEKLAQPETKARAATNS